MVLVSTREDTQLSLVFKLFQTDDTFHWVVLLELGVEKDLDGEVADHLCGSQVGSKLLIEADPPDQIQEEYYECGRQDNKNDHIQHWPRKVKHPNKDAEENRITTECSNRGEEG